MIESVPASTSFKLEREPTQFHECLSAHLHSRKSSAARSTVRKQGQSSQSRQTTATLRYNNELSNMNFINFDTESDPGDASPKSAKTYVTHERTNTKDENFNEQESEDEGVELVSTSSHIELNGGMKCMLDNAYANSAGESGLKTPPRNLQIKDLMIPLDDWGTKDHAIREKKYTVLPSIHSTPTSDGERTDFNTARHSISSSFSMNTGNQLDFFRDKIEQEADFFADFRVNTSKVKATPRQDPLPPIKHGTTERTQPSPKRHSTKSKQKSRPVAF